MAMRASTSAGTGMRGFSHVIRRQSRCSFTSQVSMRSLATTPASFKSDSPTGSDATPAREHRRHLAASAGGSDVTGGSRGSSAASTPQNKGALSQQLADLTQKLGRERSITAGREGGLAALRSIGQSGAQASRMMPMLGRQQQGQQTGQATSSPPQVQYRVSSPALAPSGYSITHVPRKHDPTIQAFINNLMRDGKKATTTTYVLDALRFMAKSLHADPLPAFREAIQLASPLVRMQTRKQGGKNTQVPLALFPRQSRRRGIMAIIEASRKRSDGEISVRIAKEIMAVLDGSSSAVTRKDDAHKLATVNRGNTGVRV